MPNYVAKTKEQLAKQIDALTSLSEAQKNQILNYSELLGALRILNKVLNDQYEKQRDNMYKVLDDQSYQRLSEAYTKVGTLCERCFNTLENNEEAKVPRDLVQSIGKNVSADMKALRRYEYTKDGVTFQLLIDGARIETANLGEANIEAVGGAMSQRLPFKYQLQDGTMLDGVFTAKKIYDPEPEIKKVMDDAANRKPYGEYFSKLYETCKNHFIEKEKKEVTSIGFAKYIHHGVSLTRGKKAQEVRSGLISYYRDLITKIDSKEAVAEFDNLCENEDFLKEMISFSNAIDKHGNEATINSSVGIHPGDRIDSRNSAMSAVADILGVPHVIARSIPMKIVLNGQEIEGTFMAKGNGIDTRSPSERSIFYTGEQMKTNGLKSLFDLRVLDFICGNTDRHKGNLMYQFSEDEMGPRGDKLLGVQGIDNDCSFGDNEELMNKQTMWNVPLKEIQVISESMAKRLDVITPDVLKFQLRGFGLTEKQLDAAAHRLAFLKAKILVDMQYFNSPEGKKEKSKYGQKEGRISIVPDNEFAKLELNKIGPQYKERQNTLISRFANPQGKGLENGDPLFKLKRVKNGGLNTEFIKNQEQVGYIMPPFEEVFANNILMGLKMATNFRGSSENFERIRRAVSGYASFAKQNKGKMLSASEYDIRTSYYMEIKNAAENYLAGKPNTKKYNSYTRTRIDTVQKLVDGINERISDTVDPDLYRNVIRGSDKSKKTILQENEERVLDAFNAKMKAEALKIQKKAADNNSPKKNNSGPVL